MSAFAPSKFAMSSGALTFRSSFSAKNLPRTPLTSVLLDIVPNPPHTPPLVLSDKEKERRKKRKDTLENKTRFGFDHRTNSIRVDGRVWKGATNVLRNAFYANYKCPVEKRRSTSARKPKMTAAKRESIRRTLSSKAKGDNFHRHVYHFFMCQGSKVELGIKRKRCNDCKERFGTYSSTITNFCDLFRMIDGVNGTLRDFGLVVVSCEVPVAWRRMNTGTMLDVVCMDKTGKLVVIELKTGYGSTFRKRASTIGTKGDKMTGKAGKHIPNSPFNQHMLQLWFGVQALKDTHDCYEVKEGYLLYFDNLGDCDYYRLSEWKSGTSLDKIEEQLYHIAVLGDRWE